jgi:hypothetical protein
VERHVVEMTLSWPGSNLGPSLETACIISAMGHWLVDAWLLMRQCM